MKRKLARGLTFVICILPIICGFISMYVQASWYVGRNYAKVLAEYMESL